MNIKKDTKLLYEVGTLRHLDRTWKQFGGADLANVAEHSFRVIWIALVLARYEHANLEKVLKIALMHDLAESRTGDVHYLSRQYVDRKEHLAIRDVLSNSVLEKELISLFDEYENRQNLEAKIVKDADNLDVELELEELKSKGDKLGSIWGNKRLKTVYPHLFTKTAKKFWKIIHSTDPHNWHNFSARNRFVSGDWKKRNGKRVRKSK